MSFNVLISWQVLCVHLLCLNSALSLESDPIFLEDELPLETIEEVHVADSFHKSDDLHNDYNNFYDYDVIDIDGDNVSLDTYRGMVTLVVNVASECGYTDGHYRSLVRLQNKLGQHNKFSVLAFPCNQFGEQEPGTRKDIQAFTKKYYHINFPLFDKINVLPPNVAEPWQFLIKSAKVAPNWNFWKYLVDENGHVLNAWGPAESVEDIFYEVRDAVNKISTHAYDEL